VNKKITGRHMEVTDAIRNYIDKKIERLQKHYDRLSEMEVILAEEGTGCKFEIIAKADHHAPFVVQQLGEDMYACLDKAVDKLERQLTRHKEKSRTHKGRAGAAEATVDLLASENSQEQQ